MSTGNGRLLFFLPGSSDATIDGKEQILQRAAYLGYHVIAVMYWNSSTGSDTAQCGEGPSSTGAFSPFEACPFGNCADANAYIDTSPITYDQCIGRVFRNHFRNFVDADKRYPTALVGSFGDLCWPRAATKDPLFFLKHGCAGEPEGRSQRKGDTALYRARKLLAYLSLAYPHDGWRQFALHHDGDYETGELDWSKVALMGHSTGTKVLVHEAHDQLVDRLIMLSGPNEPKTRAGLTEPADLDSSFDAGSHMATPLQRIYAFSNTHDPKFISDALPIWRWMRSEVTFNGVHLETIGLDGVECDAHAVTTLGIDGADCAPSGHEKRAWEAVRCDLATTDFTHGCRTSSASHACPESKPQAPGPNVDVHAIQYSGDVLACAQGTHYGDVDEGHTSTVSDESCGDATKPSTCWFMDIWDYLLTH